MISWFKYKKCSHVFDMSDAINIREHLEPWLVLERDVSKHYKKGLVDYSIICPCNKCGEVHHASCGIDLKGRIITSIYRGESNER